MAGELSIVPELLAPLGARASMSASREATASTKAKKPIVSYCTILSHIEAAPNLRGDCLALEAQACSSSIVFIYPGQAYRLSFTTPATPAALEVDPRSFADLDSTRARTCIRALVLGAEGRDGEHRFAEALCLRDADSTRGLLKGRRARWQGWGRWSSGERAGLEEVKRKAEGARVFEDQALRDVRTR